jgi:hypothetical protein
VYVVVVVVFWKEKSGLEKKVCTFMSIYNSVSVLLIEIMSVTIQSVTDVIIFQHCS